MDPNMTLPPDLAISERSRKFYDGTYTWDSEGFTDDSGVYRSFNAEDPAARAPTPLPPFLSHFEYEDKADSGTEEQPPSPTGKSQSTDSDAVHAVESDSPEQFQSAKPEAQYSSDSPEPFTFASQDGIITVHRDELFHGRSDREQLLRKLEDIQTSSQHTKTKLSLEECYRLCGISDDTAAPEIRSKGDATQPGSLKNKTSTDHERNEDKTGRTSVNTQNDGAVVNKPDSDLSDPRSDVSDGGLEQTVKGRKAAGKLAASVNNHKEDDHVDSQPKQKVTTRKAPTRGVAQKVRKGTKGARAGKLVTAVPVLLSVPTNSSVDVLPGGEDLLGRRRSTRLARQGGK